MEVKLVDFANFTTREEEQTHLLPSSMELPVEFAADEDGVATAIDSLCSAIEGCA